jgi:lipopolysaccharide export LptBFGC system permease protein LptF
MKPLLLCAFLSLLLINITAAQSEDHNTPALAKEELKEQKMVIKKVEKEQKKAAKAEKELKKEEREQKKERKLENALVAKQRTISKNGKKVLSLQQKLAKGKEKGKLSPVDMDKLNSKIDKLQLEIAKDKEKLAILLKKK